MKITNYKRSILVNALNEILNGTGISVQTPYKVTQYGVNWSAHGCRTVEETISFANSLNLAIKLATTLNAIGVGAMKIDYSNPSDRDDIRELVFMADFIDMCKELLMNSDEEGLLKFLAPVEE